MRSPGGAPTIRIAGVCGGRRRRWPRRGLARDLGYHAGLLSLAALPDADDDQLIAHCRAVAEVMPLIGFYLQPASAGGCCRARSGGVRRDRGRAWRSRSPRSTATRPSTWSAAVAEAGAPTDIALYTGNDDNIVADLHDPLRRCEIRPGRSGGSSAGCSATGRSGRGGPSSCSTRCHGRVGGGRAVPGGPARARRVEVTDANAAFFDAANGFAGCIAGIHEVLRRQGLLAGDLVPRPGRDAQPRASARRSTASGGLPAPERRRVRRSRTWTAGWRSDAKQRRPPRQHFSLR